MQELTKRQAEIYRLIRSRIKDQGYPPSVREIGKVFGISSPNGREVPSEGPGEEGED